MTNSPVVRKMIGSLLLGAAMLSPSCSQNRDKLVHENYTRIRAHSSTLADVEATLGEPTNKLDDRWLYERPDKHLVVIVEFDQTGRVTRTQWVDGLGETWHDTTDKD